jgi:putative transposase
MQNIVALLQCVEPHLAATTIKQLSRVINGMLVMTGRVTMLGIARWSGQGGSYRTVQRLYATVMPWTMLFWVFFREHLWRPGDTYLLAGDEVVVSKAGQHTHGLDRFFSSVYGKAIPGMAFFALSLVSLQERTAYPLSVEQVVRSAAEKTARKVKRTAKQAKQAKQKGADQGKRARGRPKGSKNKHKAAVTLSPELMRICTMVQGLLQRISGVLAVRYLLLDGHFGNNGALVMARTGGLHLVSKLRCDAKLYLPYVGPYSGRGPYRKYGDRLDYRALPVQQLKATTVDSGIQTAIYQLTLLHKEFCQALNVVLIVKTNQATGARAHVCLFSSDLDLAYDNLIDYYRLRFQIEFNFRDAKQFWGLEDFMNIKATAVTNAANLSLFMVNVAHCLLRNLRHAAGLDSSVLDLKAFCRGRRYAEETLKLLPHTPEPVLCAQILSKVTYLGRIHQRQTHTVSP